MSLIVLFTFLFKDGQLEKQDTESELDQDWIAQIELYFPSFLPSEGARGVVRPVELWVGGEG